MNPTQLSIITTVCAVVMLCYNIFFANSRADRKDLERRLGKLEIDDANHEQRLTGFSVQLERQGDQMADRCAKIESELSQVGRVREDVAVMKAKMDAQTASMNEIKGMVSKIFDLVRPAKN